MCFLLIFPGVHKNYGFFPKYQKIKIFSLFFSEQPNNNYGSFRSRMATQYHILILFIANNVVKTVQERNMQRLSPFQK